MMNDVIKLVGLCALVGASFAVAEPIVESRNGHAGGRSSLHSAPVENTMRSNNTLSISQIEVLEQEVRNLRGQLEVQEHELKRLTKNQQDLYLDLERRMQTKGMVPTATPKVSPVSISAKPVPLPVTPKVAVAKPSAPAPAPAPARVMYESPIEEVDAGEEEFLPIEGEELPPPIPLSGLPMKQEAPESVAATVVETPPPSVPKPTLLIKGTLAEKNIYENAYNFVLNKRYPEAVVALEDFLAQYPKGQYGSDKPDLRNPLLISDVTAVFAGSSFSAFANAIEQGAVVRAIPGPKAGSESRSFFEKLNAWAQELGLPGLGYLILGTDSAKGPIAKFLDPVRLEQLRSITGLTEGDAIFFVCDKKANAAKNAGLVRTKLGETLNLIEQNAFRFCWVIDFPLYEFNEESQKIEFSHNPFSMPQGGLEVLENSDPLTIKAYQYDIVCNGIELSSGAIRNHLPEVMYKAFSIAGYDKAFVESKFGGLLNAFKYGAPPHGGCAPGIDRIVMLIAKEPNLREIIAFPMNQQAQDLLMQAPSMVADRQLTELHIDVNLPKGKAS